MQARRRQAPAASGWPRRYGRSCRKPSSQAAEQGEDRPGLPEPGRDLDLGVGHQVGQDPALVGRPVRQAARGGQPLDGPPDCLDSFPGPGPTKGGACSVRPFQKP